MVLCFLNFFSYGTNTNFQVVQESPSDFPAVTFCNLNPFDLATEYWPGLYVFNKLTENKICPVVSVNGNEIGITKIEEAASALKSYVMTDKSLNFTDLKRLGFSWETMVISCFFNNEECTVDHFHWFRDQEFGNCYTFNSPDIFPESKKTSKTGPSSGLLMELFVGAPSSQDMYTIKRGVKVAIHERGMIPLIKEQGINVATNTAVDIGISRTKISKLGPPYSDCRMNVTEILATDSKYFKFAAIYSKYYQKFCFQLCMQHEQIIAKCGCADPNLPTLDGTNFTFCTGIALMCAKKERNKFDSEIQIDDVCGPFCPLECKSMIYSKSVSSAAYPSIYYLDILSKQANIANKFNLKNAFNPGEYIKTLSKSNITMINQNINSTSTTSCFTFSISTNNSTLNKTNNNSTNNNNSTSNISSSISADDIKSSILSFSVYLEDLRYTDITENPAITIEGLIGLLGKLILFLNKKLSQFSTHRQ